MKNTPEQLALQHIQAVCQGHAEALSEAHHQFKAMGLAAIRALGKPEHVLYDPKYLLPASDSDLRL